MLRSDKRPWWDVAHSRLCRGTIICPHHDASNQVYVTTLAVPLAASAMLSRKPYHGRLRGLVVAFDVGTTYSGISYSILDPGEVPKIQGVTRFVTSSC